MDHGLRRRLLRGEKLLGTMLTLPCAAVAEVLGEAGFDWLFVDAEHGPLEARELASILQAADRLVPCLVRVPVNAEAPIKQALDLGAAGVIVPQIRGAADAAAAVRHARYAPKGERGVGLARAHGYGFRFKEYIEAANDEIVVVVQAEHADAVADIDAIVAVEGVDAVLLGPYDLSASLGRMGEVDSPEVVAAIERVGEACGKARVPLGIFGVSADAVAPYAERGCTLIVAGVDTLFIGQGARRLLGQLGGNEG